MQQEVERKDASPEHVAKCREKLRILLEQRADLSMAITQLLDEIESGKKYMKVYKQMKMYNDPALNPVLYKSNTLFMPYRKVLIIRLSALGDVAMTIPVVYSVCRAYPETTFVMLTQKWLHSCS